MNIALSEKTDWRARLATALESSGRSKREVSLTAGLGPNFLHEVLSYDKEPSFKNLRAIASELGLSVSYLIGETQQ